MKAGGFLDAIIGAIAGGDEGPAPFHNMPGAPQVQPVGGATQQLPGLQGRMGVDDDERQRLAQDIMRGGA